MCKWTYSKTPRLRGYYLVTLYNDIDDEKTLWIRWWTGSWWNIDESVLSVVAWMPVPWVTGNGDTYPEEDGYYLVQTFGPGGCRPSMQYYRKGKGWDPFYDKNIHVVAWDKIPELA